jgi:quercetin dioxygenase-like cupin family protein
MSASATVPPGQTAFEAIQELEKVMKAKAAATFLGLLLLATGAHAQNAKRIELKRAVLTGTNMEIHVAIAEVPPGAKIALHKHAGEEVLFLLNGGTLKYDNGEEVKLETGSADIISRDVVHGGATVVGTETVKFLTVHIVDQGGPLAIRIQPK